MSRRQAFEALLTFEMDFHGEHFTELSEGAQEFIKSLLQACDVCCPCLLFMTMGSAFACENFAASDLHPVADPHTGLPSVLWQWHTC